MSPSHLAPPSLDGYYGSDISAPSSPLSVEFDVHLVRNSPFNFANIPGTPTHLQTGSNGLFGPGDLATADAIRGMNLTGGNSSPEFGYGWAWKSDGSSTFVIHETETQSSCTVRPVPSNPTRDAFSYVPDHPSLPQPHRECPTSPTSYVPLQQAFNSSLNSSVDSFTDSGFGTNVTGAGPQYADVFEGDMDPNESGGMLFGNGDRSQSGSHRSIGSSYSRHGGFLQPNAASPYPPGSAAASPNMGVISDLSELAILGQSDSTAIPAARHRRDAARG